MLRNVNFYVGLVYIIVSVALFTISNKALAQSTTSKKYADRKFLDAPVDVDLSHVTMAEAVTKLSDAAHISVLVDGEPHQNLTNFTMHAPLRDLLDTLGQTFDYDWTLTNTNIVIYRKAFNRRGERPQLHVAEMQRLMKEIDSAFKSVPQFERGDPRAKIIRQLAKTLTPEQLDLLSQGKPMPASQLLPDQLSILHTAILASTFGAMTEQVNEYTPLIENFASSFLMVKNLPNAPDSGAARAQAPPRRDYIFVVRDKNKKLIAHYLAQWAGGE